MSTGQLPEFANPPVSEVAISALFDPLANWHAPYAGVYWSKISARYPKTEVKPPLVAQLEQFGDLRWQQPVVRIEPVDLDAQRYWFISAPANYLIQVQRDLFATNWRKLENSDVYPRYEGELRTRFLNEWSQFLGFLAEQHIPPPIVKQCEVAYVNDILYGEGWCTFSEALELFAPWWKACSDNFLSAPDTLTVNGSFAMPNESGRLSFSAQHVRREKDAGEAIRFSLVAKSRPLAGTLEGMMKALDTNREWVVRGFASLTSPRGHAIWKRSA